MKLSAVLIRLTHLRLAQVGRRLLHEIKSPAVGLWLSAACGLLAASTAAVAGPFDECHANLTRIELEPNNTVATAQWLGLVDFTAVRASLNPGGGDSDYYRFVAANGSKVWMTVDTGGGPPALANPRDSILTLLAADGVSVIEQDNNDGSGNGSDSTTESFNASAIAGRALSAGTYYVRVRSAVNNPVVTPYRLLMTVTTGSPSGEVDPNNSSFFANPIFLAGAHSGVRSGRINANDTDYYSFAVNGRSGVHISADGDPERDGTGTDVRVDLLDPDGIKVLYSANSSASGSAGNPPAEGFDFVVPVAGAYRVRVSGVGSAAGTYHLMVSACPLPLPNVSAVSVGHAVVVSWPTDAADFRLQTSSNLSAWTDYGPTLPAPDDSGRYTLTLPITSQMRFFRLIASE